MINILMVVPNVEDSTSLYRASGPFSELRRQALNINLVFLDRVGENMLDMADLVFMQRPCADNHLQLAEMCNRNGIPLWIDYDDFLLDVPEDNPYFDQYAKPEVRKMIVKIIQLANYVTVSTAQLKVLFSEMNLNQNIEVIPNCIPDRFMAHAREYTHKPHVNWRGSNTHQRDVAEYTEELIELANERNNTTFTFVGYNPWFATQHMPKKQTIVIPPMTIGEYFRFMEKTNPSVQIVPLASNIFNLCKSNIAAMEGVLAGAVPVVPAWPEWEIPGSLQYTSAAEFKAHVQHVLDNPEDSKVAHQAALAWIIEHRDIKKWNFRRIAIIEKLMRGPSQEYVKLK